MRHVQTNYYYRNVSKSPFISPHIRWGFVVVVAVVLWLFRLCSYWHRVCFFCVCCMIVHVHTPNGINGSPFDKTVALSSTFTSATHSNVIYHIVSDSNVPVVTQFLLYIGIKRFLVCVYRQHSIPIVQINQLFKIEQPNFSQQRWKQNKKICTHLLNQFTYFFVFYLFETVFSLVIACN